ncbi:hypothetical protein [Paraburkholderia sp. BL10I2N1]|uniref:hypothetical protein n=1 Tax=Paraburkholderia sp. BL10I2N1 TaxID=1938796 RepID=UPI00105DA22D|nr:hypothetical protein [Paraburkholderia sp. BL10I2N1]TDN58956.1 hypothetical protein B0G77_8137 [Paraburkholderia sp. BL10I2N1]
MDYRKRTGITFGPIEAYARRHLRTAAVVDTSIRISLQETGTDNAARSPLLRLVENAPLSLGDLRDLLPSLGSHVWQFSEIAGSLGYQLMTVSDGIEVTLSVAGADFSLSTIEIEGMLRGGGGGSSSRCDVVIRSVSTKIVERLTRTF